MKHLWLDWSNISQRFFSQHPNDRAVTFALHIKWHTAPPALRGNLRGLLNISAWLCKTVCSAHNRRCLGLNVLEKGRENLYGALRWSPLIINSPVSLTFLSSATICGHHRPVAGLVLLYTSCSVKGLICAWLAPTSPLINSHGKQKASSVWAASVRGAGCLQHSVSAGDWDPYDCGLSPVDAVCLISRLWS